MYSSISNTDPDCFDQKTTRFLDWFSASPGTRVSQKIQLADLRFRNSGRGLVALHAIAENEELFAVPMHLVLTAATSDIPKEIVEAIDTGDAWLPLIVTLIYEFLRKDTSPWYSYFQVLPSAFNTLMFWSESELACLQASAVVGKIGKANTEAAWKDTIIPLMLEHPNVFPVEMTDVAAKATELIRLAHLAGSLIMAYAFDIDKEEEESESLAQDTAEDSGLVSDDESDPLKGMVPFADMLNANADKNNARLFQEDNCLIMRSIKGIPAGEEIFNDYGALPRSDLLRMYGYVTDNYSQYDVVEISYDLLVKTSKGLTPGNDADAWEKLADGADEYDLLEEGYIIPRPASDANLQDAISAQFQMLLRYLCGGKCKHRDWNDEECVANIDLTAQEIQLLQSVLQERLAEYSTTLEEDKLEFADFQSRMLPGPPPSTSMHRINMAIQVRVGEKEICHEVVRMCQERLQSASIPTNGTTKRSRDESAPSGKTQKDSRMEKKVKR